MSQKRTKNEVVVKVPHDCWCHIIEFFSSPKDLVSLVCVVKGLYRYIKQISPQCTNNVVFDLLQSLPSRRQPHISTLLVENRLGVDKSPKRRRDPSYRMQPCHILEFIRNKGMEDLTSLFEAVLSKYPNLQDLRINLVHQGFTGYIPRASTIYDSLTPMVVKLDMSYTITLVHLSLRLFECDLSITPSSNSTFPNLQSLHLKRCSRDYTVVDWTMPGNLNISFSQLRRLKRITLLGWRMRGESFPDWIEELEMTKSFLPERSTKLAGIRDLRSLKLGGSTSICTISDLPNLTEMDITITKSDLPKMYEAGEAHVLSGFPKLEKLTVSHFLLQARSVFDRLSTLPTQWKTDFRALSLTIPF